MKFSFGVLVIALLFSASITARQGADLSMYKAPKNMKNIHVETIGSSKTSSEFIIFVKDEVKAHFHKEHTELVYVLEGEGIFKLGETRQMIKPGDFIRINEGVIHAVTVTSKTPLKVLSIQTPEFKGKDRYFIHEK